MQRVVFVLAALALTACGGGGGGSPVASMSAPSSANTSAELEEFRALVGGEPINLTSAQISNALRARQGAADRFLATDGISLSLSGIPSRVAVTCAGAICSGDGMAFSPADLDFSDQSYVAVMTRNGVSMTAGASRTASGEDGTDLSAESYGGWLKHNAFLVARDSLVGADNVAQSVDIFALSIGRESGSNPVSGSATWVGTMAGMDTADVQILHGDTELTADFASSNVDVAFTGIYDEDSQRRANILWDDVPMTSNGFASLAQGRIDGTFYGPDHAEVGGIFERDSIVGAFGAKRQ